MRVTEVHGRKVVNLEDAETLGRVDRYVVDPSKRAVVALRLSKVKGDACFLSWTDLHTFGPDAVTVSKASCLRPAADEAEERAASNELQVIGKLVLTQSGTALGKDVDVEVDPESGTIVALDLGEAGTVAGDRIIGLGSYALIVSDAPPA
jgi:sporulation protein YlmC with PRC-barrel domain